MRFQTDADTSIFDKPEKSDLRFAKVIWSAAKSRFLQIGNDIVADAERTAMRFLDTSPPPPPATMVGMVRPERTSVAEAGRVVLYQTCGGKSRRGKRRSAV